MATIQGEDLADLLNASEKNVEKFKFTEIASDLQDYVALRNLLRKKRVTFQGGTHVVWQVLVSTTGRAKNTGLYEVDDVNVGNVLQNAEVPWKHSTVNWAIERREIAMNAPPRQIVDLKKVRRAEAMIDWAELEENNFWGVIGSSTTKKPFGVRYWLVRNATTGFNGGHHAQFSSGPGGLSSTDYPNWKNYSGTYTSVTKEDLIRTMRKASAFCGFRSPAPGVRDYNTGDRFGYYTVYDVLALMEEGLEAQNDNLGNDLASKDGMVMFRRNPVEWVPWLQKHENRTDGDVTTVAPIYGINWGVFKCAFLAGEYMREKAWKEPGNQHTVAEKFMDMTRNWTMKDRRRCFVLYYAA